MPIRAVACASTGDTSAALSAYCAAAGIPSVVFLPQGQGVARRSWCSRSPTGARVLSLDTDFDGCMRLVQEVTQDAGLYLANSMNSLRIEGQKVVAIELCQQLGWEPPDWVVIPGGNLGNASALGKGFELMLALGLISRRPRIAVAQAQRANPLYRAFRGGFQELLPMKARAHAGLGNPDWRPGVLPARGAGAAGLRRGGGGGHRVRAGQRGGAGGPGGRLRLSAHGRGAGGAGEAGGPGRHRAGSRVAVVSTAHGLKFPDFKVGYHRGTLADVTSRYANPPVELPADLDAVREALANL